MSKSPKKTKQKTGKVRLVRPYPQLPLEKALGVVSAIKEANGGNPLEPVQIAEFCKVSPKSSDLVYLLSATSRFGLTVGSISSEKIALTETGRELAYAPSKDKEDEFKLKAFLSVEIFKKVIEHYQGSQLPEMKYLGNTLQKEFGLPPELHDEFSTLFRENTQFLGISSVSVTGSDSTGTPTTLAPSTVTVSEPKDKTGRVCFVIMPFSERTSKYAPGFFTEVLNSLIIPAATAAGFEVRTANKLGTEIIHSTIVNEVIDADLAVCDLTEHNPNVLFELGIRLSNEKPVALIHAEGTDRVFDVDNILRVQSYSSSLWRTTLEKDIPKLKDHFVATWEGRDKNDTYMGALKKMRQKK